MSRLESITFTNVQNWKRCAHEGCNFGVSYDRFTTLEEFETGSDEKVYCPAHRPWWLRVMYWWARRFFA
jgi:hypothetical protein